MTRTFELAFCLVLLASTQPIAQVRPQTPPPPPPGVTPQPVGRGGETRPAAPPASSPAPPRQATAPPSAATAAPATGPAIHAILPPEPVPTEAQLGVPVYPGARFIKSFDAGQGQRYYLYGSTASFAELVLYYRTQLRERGDLVYDQPPVHMFEVGRFREETMAFPPGVTIKDYTWGGGKGYLVPTPGVSPSRFPTIIQIVPVLAANR